MRINYHHERAMGINCYLDDSGLVTLRWCCGVSRSCLDKSSAARGPEAGITVCSLFTSHLGSLHRHITPLQPQLLQLPPQTEIFDQHWFELFDNTGSKLRYIRCVVNGHFMLIPHWRPRFGFFWLCLSLCHIIMASEIKVTPGVAGEGPIMTSSLQTIQADQRILLAVTGISPTPPERCGWAT